MHFSTLYILKDKTLDSVSFASIEERFCRGYCSGCGELEPVYNELCDWFQIGGRWGNPFSASRGIKGEVDCEIEPSDPHFAIVETKDLKEKLDCKSFYFVVMEEDGHVVLFNDYTFEGTNKIKATVKSINNGKIEGVIAMIDCHE